VEHVFYITFEHNKYIWREGQFSIDYIYTFWAQSHEQRSNNHTVHRTIIMLDFKWVHCFHVYQTIPYWDSPSPHREFRRAYPHQLYHQPPPSRPSMQWPSDHLKLISVEQRGWKIDTSLLSEATNHFEKHLNESFVICSSKTTLPIEKLLCFLIHHDLTGLFILVEVCWQNYIFIASRLIKSVSSLFRFD